MSEHIHHGLVGRHLKNCCVVARNKRDLRVNLMAWQHEAETQRIIDAAEEAAKAEPAADGGGEWVGRAQGVLNRLTGKRKRAKDRWAGFAGTSGGPSRGR